MMLYTHVLGGIQRLCGKTGTSLPLAWKMATLRAFCASFAHLLVSSLMLVFFLRTLATLKTEQNLVSRIIARNWDNLWQVCRWCILNEVARGLRCTNCSKRWVSATRVQMMLNSHVLGGLEAFSDETGREVRLAWKIRILGHIYTSCLILSTLLVFSC